MDNNYFKNHLRNYWTNSRPVCTHLNVLLRTIWIWQWKFEFLFFFLKLTNSTSLKNYWTNTRLVCTDCTNMNAFVMVNPNMAMNTQISTVLYKLKKITLISRPFWTNIMLVFVKDLFLFSFTNERKDCYSMNKVCHWYIVSYKYNSL